VIPGRIAGATRYLGAPADWDPDRSPPCASLAVRDGCLDDGLPIMESVWEPTPAELLALAAGAKVTLCIAGTAHPAVAVSVSEPPA
jgi:hypothetical protein